VPSYKPSLFLGQKALIKSVIKDSGFCVGCSVFSSLNNLPANVGYSQISPRNAPKGLGVHFFLSPFAPV